MPTGEHSAVTTVLVGGHESAYGSDLLPLLDLLPDAVVTRAGRALHNTVATSLAAGETVVVVTMTWGRDPVMVADVAKTLSWLASDAGGRLALAPSFGTVDHLVAWLRRAARETARQRPEAGVLVTAPSSNPFDDAELHRIAHLVRTHGAGVQVEVACVAEPSDLGRAVERALLLGSDDVVVVPAGFGKAPPPGLPGEHATVFGPLLSEAAVLDIVRRRVSEAQHELGHGRDGIAAGLLADHGHGYAHSHAFEDGAAPGHGGHVHPHVHPHHVPHETPVERGASHDEVLTSPHH